LLKNFFFCLKVSFFPKNLFLLIIYFYVKKFVLGQKIKFLSKILTAVPRPATVWSFCILQDTDFEFCSKLLSIFPLFLGHYLVVSGTNHWKYRPYHLPRNFYLFLFWNLLEKNIYLRKGQFRAFVIWQQTFGNRKCFCIFQFDANKFMFRRKIIYFTNIFGYSQISKKK